MPLFETLTDLNNAADVCETLFSLPGYLTAIKNKQEIMVCKWEYLYVYDNIFIYHMAFWLPVAHSAVWDDDVFSIRQIIRLSSFSTTSSSAQIFDDMLITFYRPLLFDFIFLGWLLWFCQRCRPPCRLLGTIRIPRENGKSGWEIWCWTYFLSRKRRNGRPWRQSCFVPCCPCTSS